MSTTRSGLLCWSWWSVCLLKSQRILTSRTLELFQGLAHTTCQQLSIRTFCTGTNGQLLQYYHDYLYIFSEPTLSIHKLSGLLILPHSCTTWILSWQPVCQSLPLLPSFAMPGYVSLNPPFFNHVQERLLVAPSVCLKNWPWKLWFFLPVRHSLITPLLLILQRVAFSFRLQNKAGSFLAAFPDSAEHGSCSNSINCSMVAQSAALFSPCPPSFLGSILYLYLLEGLECHTLWTTFLSSIASTSAFFHSNKPPLYLRWDTVLSLMAATTQPLFNLDFRIDLIPWKYSFVSFIFNSSCKTSLASNTPRYLYPSSCFNAEISLPSAGNLIPSKLVVFPPFKILWMHTSEYRTPQQYIHYKYG